MLSRLKHSPRTASIRKYTNLLYYDPTTVTVNIKNIDTVEVDGCKFYIHDQIVSLQRVKGNPWFEGIRPTDIVVDIGACVGSVTIPLAKAAKKVYAIEPLFYEELWKNVELNNLANVEVVPWAIGRETGFAEVSFAGRKRRVNVTTFKNIRETVDEDRIDFLKMDGEGCEWDIQPRELKGIRELRIEFHIRRGRVRECKKKYQEYIRWMLNEGYKVTIEHPHYGPDPYDKEDYMVRASMKNG